MAQKSFEKKLKELKKLATEEHMHVFEDLSRIENKLSGEGEKVQAWDKVSLARHPERPTTLDYLEKIFDRFLELKGDRHYSDDPALLGGIALFDGMPVTVMGHQKGRNLKENIYRNYGMAHPEGYRKALRLAKEAETFGRPIITFVDTSGAYPGVSSEERGIGEAIAKNLKEFSVLEVPIISIIIGEGGSGGALGIAVGDEVYMMENSIYSVISPEGCASILLRDASRAKLAADLMKLTAEDLYSFRVVQGIIPEPEGGAHKDFAAAASNMRDQISESLSRLMAKRQRQLLKERSDKLLSLGPFYGEVEKRQGLFERLFKHS
jgi:acetyl-CoA carboxylase carboxyl transferase subunit alpha